MRVLKEGSLCPQVSSEDTAEEDEEEEEEEDVYDYDMEDPDMDAEVTEKRCVCVCVWVVAAGVKHYSMMDGSITVARQMVKCLLRTSLLGRAHPLLSTD